MAGSTYTPETLEWHGGHPALDFVNTLDTWAPGQKAEDYLHGYEDLLDWNQKADFIGPNSRRSLSQGSAEAKAAAFAEAQALRRDLHALFQAVAHGAELPQRALDHLNALVQQTAAWRKLSAEGAKMSCGWSFKGAPPVAVLGPLVWRAAELLENGPLDRIKECPPPQGCGWLFLDTSKNRSRQWCSMQGCGTLAKVRNFRERRKKTPGASV